MMPRLAAAAVLALSLMSTPVVAQTNGVSLDLPSELALGETFQYCMSAPPGWPAVLLASFEPGPVATEFGPIHVGAPIQLIAIFSMAAPNDVCFPCGVPCSPALLGKTAYLQIVAFDPNDHGNFGLSEARTVTFRDDGLCTEPGDFTSFTYTQGGWGAPCHGHNPGCVRDDNFPFVFPNGMACGDPDGLDGDDRYVLILDSAAAVEALLPNGGTPAPLAADEVDPASSSAGVLTGQLVAAKLNVVFDAAGVFDAAKSDPTILLQDLVFTSGVAPSLIGLSVAQVLDLAEVALSGEPLPGGLSCSDISDALTVLNENFDEGNADQGHLALPPSP